MRKPEYWLIAAAAGLFITGCVMQLWFDGGRLADTFAFAGLAGVIAVMARM